MHSLKQFEGNMLWYGHCDDDDGEYDITNLSI